MNKDLIELAKAAENKGYTLKEGGSLISFWAEKGNLTIQVGFHLRTGNIILDTYFTTPQGCFGIYNPTYYREGTLCKLFDGYAPTAKNFTRLLDEIDYMQTNDIKLYIGKDDSRRMA